MTLGDAKGNQIPVWNVSDLLMVINAWGTPDGDITGDGLTNVNDLLYVINHWGQEKYPFFVNPPVNPTTIPLTDGYLLLDNITDGERFDTTIDGQPFGIKTGNGQTSTRIHTKGFVATNCQPAGGMGEGYGFYGAPVVDHFHEHVKLTQSAGVNQVLVRVGGGDRFILDMAVLNNTLAMNDSCRFYGISNSAVVNSRIDGGIYKIGVPYFDEVHPEGPNCNQWPQNLIDHWVTNVTFNRSQPNGPNFPAAFDIGFHVHKVVFDDVRVFYPGGRFVDIDRISPCTPNDPHAIVEIRHCTLNGQPVTLSGCHGDLTNVTIIN